MTENRGATVKLTLPTKQKLERLREVLELAYRHGLPSGVKPPRVSQAATVDAAIDLLTGVLYEKLEVYPAGVVTDLMMLAGISTGNGVLKLMGEQTGATVELGPDGRPALKVPESAEPVPIPLEQLPDARAAATTQPPMAQA